MNIEIVGAGVVGQATGKGFARLGHEVVFHDIDETRCQHLREEGYRASALPNTNDADIVFFCVPEKVIEDVVVSWGAYFKLNTRDALFVIRSTVPPGTTEEIAITSNRHICFNPEFLREAVAEYEFLNPPGVILGECCEEHGDLLESLYKPLRVPIHRVDPTTAEFTKIVINSYLACQISFWTQVKWIAEAKGVNSHEVGMLASFCDSRVSCYGARMHGQPYKHTKCLPKDLTQLINAAKVSNVDSTLLDAVRYIDDKADAEVLE